MKSLLETYLQIYEHDELYPQNIKDMTISSFLTHLKEKDKESYHTVESIIEKFFLKNSENVSQDK